MCPNLTETGVHTVMTPGVIVLERGTKQVCFVTFAERGELATLGYTITISAAGTSLRKYIKILIEQFYYSKLFI